VVNVFSVLEKVRRQQPLVHHLTNWVTIFDCAQIVKSFGGSPIMAHAPEEAADMSRLAGATVLNIGTLTVELVDAMKLAACAANEKGAPVVLDACGAGATKLRDEKCFELLDTAKINIIKGNASEVSRIAGENVRTKGVDAMKVEHDLVAMARSLAKRRACTVVVTGPEDIVSDGKTCYLVKNGHEMMSHLVGTGCMAASVIGAFAAVEPDLAAAAAAGLSCFEIAAELAVRGSRGPGSFRAKLFDCAFQLSRQQVESMQKVEVAE